MYFGRPNISRRPTTSFEKVSGSKCVDVIISQNQHKTYFGSLVILDVARCYLWLFTLYINIKISKNSC